MFITARLLPSLELSSRNRSPYSPTLAAAFSLNKLPSRIYRLTIAVERCPVCFMMALSYAPPIAAAVANPDLKLCPANSAGSLPAAAAALFTINATARSESRIGRT